MKSPSPSDFEWGSVQMTPLDATSAAELDGDEEQLIANDRQTSTASNARHKPRTRGMNMCMLTCVAIIIVVTGIAVLVSRSSYADPTPSEVQDTRKRNVIFMISDGFGPTSENIARIFYQTLKQEEYDFELPLDSLQVGSLRTRSASSLVTDSAAGATAFSCGIKTNNGILGMTPSGNTCPTVMECAHRKGWATGLISTARVTHATPAAFVAHVSDRNDEYEIAKQELFGIDDSGRPVDLLFGGGSLTFDKDRRPDGRDLLREIREKSDSEKWTIVEGRSDFDDIDVDSTTLPLIGLFTEDHMSYELDRETTKEPSLAEMTATALELLGRSVDSDDKPGLFVMIEGSRIDMAGHSKDPAGHIWDILSFQEAFIVAKKFADAHPGTIVISTSDHETGGVSAARQMNDNYPEYYWQPETLLKIKVTAEGATRLLFTELKRMESDDGDGALSAEEYRQAIRTFIVNNLGVQPVPWYDAIEKEKLSGAASTFVDGKEYTKALYPDSYYFTRADINVVYDYYRDIDSKRPHEGYNPTILGAEFVPLIIFFGDLMSKNAQIGWSTSGHSGADVGLYIYDPGTSVEDPKTAQLPMLTKSFLKGIQIPWLSSSKLDISEYPDIDASSLKGSIENIDIGLWLSDQVFNCQV